MSPPAPFGKQSRTVFVSSTSLDLKEFRAIAQTVIQNLHLARTVMEDFETDGRSLPIDECLRRVRDEADFVVAIVAKRYGWVPAEEPANKDWAQHHPEHATKSITWLECLEARRKGIRVFPFVLAEEAEWPSEFAEPAHTEHLNEFRRWIQSNYLVQPFQTPDDFRNQLTRLLVRWVYADDTQNDPSTYFEWIRKRASVIVSPPGTLLSADEGYAPLGITEFGERRQLEHVFKSARVFFTGAPGAGKSTALSHYAWELAKASDVTSEALFPLLMDAGEIWNHVLGHSKRNAQGSPVSLDSPLWISHFFSHESERHRWGLTRSYFEGVLSSGYSAILIDGLDQSSPRISALIDALTETYPRCQIVLSGRPWVIDTFPVLSGFRQITISPLDNATIKRLLLKRLGAKFSRPDEAQRRANALYRAVISQPSVRRLARQPLLLNLMCEERSNPDDLPVAAASLYQSIIARFSKAPSLSEEENAGYNLLDVLQELAWALKSRPGHKGEVSLRWAAGRVNGSMPGLTATAAARELESIAGRTGILICERERVRFWHSMLQDYLAARRLAYNSPEERLASIPANFPNAAATESWENVLVLLAQLLEPETEDIDDLVSELFDSYRKAADAKLWSVYARFLLVLRRELPDFVSSSALPWHSMLGELAQRINSAALEEIDIRARIELLRLSGAERKDGELEWADIPAGGFWMGAQNAEPQAPRYDPDALEPEGPVRWFCLASFQISRAPVTVQQYAQFIAAGGYNSPDFWSAGGYSNWRTPLQWEAQLHYPNHPVTGVSWYEASAFCKWRGCRLPTEEEWERSASSTDGRRFPWGNELPDGIRANYGRLFGGVTPVGVFRQYASVEHVNDLAGNVWEWVNAEYAWKSRRGIARLNKVLRGGSHANHWRFLRTSDRIGARAEERFSNFGHIGFRCAR